MLILKIAAFWMPVIGLGGLVGAIETGTSPVNAAIVLLIGCILFALYYRLDSIRYRRDKEIDRLIRNIQEGGREKWKVKLTNGLKRKKKPLKWQSNITKARL